MRISKFGHSCLLLEEAEARILIDPGSFSAGFEDLVDLDAILITHQHADHLVPDNLAKLLEHNPQAQLLADEGSVAVLEQDGRVKAQAVHAGEEFEVAGVKIKVAGSQHAIIHQSIPGISNVGYLVAGKFFYPGDALTILDEPVDVLAMPLSAPWLKISEVIDYVTAVRPKVAIPVHDAVLSMPDLYAGIVEKFAGDVSTQLRIVANGTATEV